MGTLLAHLKDACTWYLSAHFSMALGLQWTEFIVPGMLVCANHPIILLSFGANVLPASYFNNAIVELEYLIYNPSP
jgi:hypothetical protein